jgi:hypothetical protein
MTSEAEELRAAFIHIAERDPYLVEELNAWWGEREAYRAACPDDLSTRMQDYLLERGFFDAIKAYVADPLQREAFENAIAACRESYKSHT